MYVLVCTNQNLVFNQSVTLLYVVVIGNDTGFGYSENDTGFAPWRVRPDKGANSMGAATVSDVKVYVHLVPSCGTILCKSD